jgi:signal transduction histidine kinase
MTFSLPAVLALAVVCFTTGSVQAQSLGGDAPLMTVKQIRDKNQANLSVMVRGTVTATDVVRIFVQDATGGIGIIRSGIRELVVVGDFVEVKGTTTGQGALLGLNGLTLTKTGTAPLPKAEVLTAERLDAGEAKNQRVRLSGTVHEVGVNSGMLILQIQSGGASFMAMWQGNLPNAETRVLVPRMDLLDADVEVEGVAIAQISISGSRIGFRLVMGSDEAPHLKVLRPGSADVFTRPLRTLASLKGLKAHNNQRWRVKGVVTYWSEAQWFHLQDETGTGRGNNAHFMPRSIGWLYREGRSEPVLRPGDEVELVGMPVITSSGHVSLSRCEWRVTGHIDPPPFEPIPVTSIIDQKLEGRPVSVTGRVVDVDFTIDYQGFAVHTLWVESGEVSFSAIVQKKKRGVVPVKAGDYVRLEGVVTTSPNVVGRAAFRLNMNDFTAIHLVPGPPAWQSIDLLRWLPFVGAVAGLALIWIFLLRRQVAQQTAQLRANALQLQTQLEQEKELSEMKSRFVFTVSHEFRNPLAVIMSCSDVLQRFRDRMSAEQHERQITGIQQSVRRMADMMEEVLLLGRAESGRLLCQPEMTDVRALCLRLLDQVASATSARCPVELTCDKDLPLLPVDPSLLQHILTNLITNAVKYSPADMTVDVAVKHETEALTFTVTDRGQGIPTLDQARIFEPFHRGSNVGETPGTGLGLAIVERCVGAHGGSIQCESHSGEGTSFVVRLPFQSPDTSES